MSIDHLDDVFSLLLIITCQYFHQPESKAVRQGLQWDSRNSCYSLFQPFVIRFSSFPYLFFFLSTQYYMIQYLSIFVSYNGSQYQQFLVIMTHLFFAYLCATIHNIVSSYQYIIVTQYQQFLIVVTHLFFFYVPTTIYNIVSYFQYIIVSQYQYFLVTVTYCFSSIYLLIYIIHKYQCIILQCLSTSSPL